LAVHQATVLTWDILRYQQMKIGVLRSHQRPALESLLRKIKVRSASKMGISEVVAQSEARELAAPWFKDPASRPAMMRVIENAGFPPDALEVEAFQLALPTLATIERLVVSAQKCLDKFLDDLERTSKASARALRLAAEKAIAANKSDQSQASMKQANGIATADRGEQAQWREKSWPTQSGRQSAFEDERASPWLGRGYHC